MQFAGCCISQWHCCIFISFLIMPCYHNSQCFKDSSWVLHYLSLHSFQKTFPTFPWSTFQPFLVSIFFLCLYLSLSSAEFIDYDSSFLYSLNQVGQKHEIFYFKLMVVSSFLLAFLNRSHCFPGSVKLRS